MMRDDDIWSKTYRKQVVPGLPDISIITAVGGEEQGDRYLYLCSDLSIKTSGAGKVTARCDIDMTPAQMRALAAQLEAAATRIECELMPLLRPAPEIIPIELYHEPEAA